MTDSIRVTPSTACRIVETVGSTIGDTMHGTHLGVSRSVVRFIESPMLVEASILDAKIVGFAGAVVVGTLSSAGTVIKSGALGIAQIVTSKNTGKAGKSLFGAIKKVGSLAAKAPGIKQVVDTGKSFGAEIKETWIESGQDSIITMPQEMVDLTDFTQDAANNYITICAQCDTECEHIGNYVVDGTNWTRSSCNRFTS